MDPLEKGPTQIYSTHSQYSNLCSSQFTVTTTLYCNIMAVLPGKSQKTISTQKTNTHNSPCRQDMTSLQCINCNHLSIHQILVPCLYARLQVNYKYFLSFDTEIAMCDITMDVSCLVNSQKGSLHHVMPQ
jgi:hypothetical protein